MQKLKKILLISCGVIAIYSIGKVRGHVECLDNVIKKNDGNIFKDADEFVDTIGKFAAIAVKKPTEKETEDLNA